MKKATFEQDGYTAVRTAQGVLGSSTNAAAPAAYGSACGAGDK